MAGMTGNCGANNVKVFKVIYRFEHCSFNVVYVMTGNCGANNFKVFNVIYRFEHCSFNVVYVMIWLLAAM